MFALREIIKEKLYALAGENGSDIFHQCFQQWQDVTQLHEFFLANPASLLHYGMGKKEAIKKILREAEQFENDLLAIAQDEEINGSLDELIFTPLHLKDDFVTPFLQSKAHGRESTPSFLRLYAIRLNDGCYIVVGGLIKTTRSLQESKEGKAMLIKLKEVADFLKQNNYEDIYNIAELILYKK